MPLSDVRWNRTSNRALEVEENNPLLNAQGLWGHTRHPYNIIFDGIFSSQYL